MRQLRWMLVIIPALVIGGFETIRHTLLEQVLPLELGNWVTAFIDAIVIALITQKLIGRFTQTQRELHSERALRLILEERERLARALHDQIAQTIFYSGVQLTSAKQIAYKMGNDDLSGKLEDIGVSLREIDDNVRQCIFNLRENQEEHVDIRSRFHSYLGRALDGTSIEWVLKFPETEISLTLNEQIQLFGIMQELVTNIIKHAKATKIQISFNVNTRNNKWELSVADNGVGFSDDIKAMRTFGMDIVQTRACDIGAKISIVSGESGVTITVVPGEDQDQLMSASTL